MSRAFVKEDADADPVVVAARAPLPDGVPNLVTAAGLAALERERDALEAALEAARGDGDPRAEAAAAEQLDALRARLASARPVPLADPLEVAQVGAVVVLRRADGRTLRFRIVGVDEADPAAGRVAFTAPVAAAVLGQGVGARVEAALGGGPTRFELVALER